MRNQRVTEGNYRSYRNDEIANRIRPRKQDRGASLFSRCLVYRRHIVGRQNNRPVSVTSPSADAGAGFVSAPFQIPGIQHDKIGNGLSGVLLCLLVVCSPQNSKIQLGEFDPQNRTQNRIGFDEDYNGRRGHEAHTGRVNVEKWLSNPIGGLCTASDAARWGARDKPVAAGPRTILSGRRAALRRNASHAGSGGSSGR